MHMSIPERALLRSLLAGAVVLAACSPSDRADADRDAGEPSVAAVPADSQMIETTPTPGGDSAIPQAEAAASPGTAADTNRGVSGYQPMARQTATPAASDTSIEPSNQDDTVAVGDSAHIGKPGERLDESQPLAIADTVETESESDRIRPPEDSSETIGAVEGSTEMARDTSTDLAQGDTSSPDQPDTAAQFATDSAVGEASVDTTTTTAQAADTSAIQVSMDTTTADEQTEIAVETEAGPAVDTSVVVGDSAEAGKPGERLDAEIATAEANADTLADDADRIRPPEDSTEVLGNVTGEDANAETGDAESRDAAPVAAAGVESTGGVVTGANAVAQMSRQGQNCAVATDPADIRWDMASSPATLNPCGTGTMTLPRIVTAE